MRMVGEWSGDGKTTEKKQYENGKIMVRKWLGQL